KPMEFRVLTKAMNLYPYQKLYFTTLNYKDLKPVYCGDKRKLEDIKPEENILLITGIASPRQIIYDLKPYSEHIVPMTFGDHHQFTKKDIQKINERFAEMPEPKIAITTEKDNARLFGMEGLSDELRHHLFVLPVEIGFMLDQQEEFNQKIIGYVRKNSRNSILVKGKDDHKPANSNRAGNGSRTISFRNN
ncbi:MAG: tetraacyldisaccharide 4'-kinase, partial [Prevotella sp.]|nr:tetraacyldisaccharide 4'-kinase [Prevotella sp.]